MKNEYREMISDLKAAWSLVGHKLKNHRKSVVFSPRAIILDMTLLRSTPP